MKLNDLLKPAVGIAIAIVPDSEDSPSEWTAYIINLRSDTLKNVLITTNGYGQIGEKSLKTSTIRYFFDEIPSNTYAKIEPIVEEVFGLNNEYWVSYSVGNEMQDKRYIFLPETIQPNNFSTIPLMEKRGVMIK